MHDSLQALVEAGDHQGALAFCRERIAAAPGDAAAHRHLALLRAAGDERGCALAAGKRACELAPDDPRSWSDLGRVYVLLGEMENAARCFAEAVEIDARYADGWHNLGTAMRQLGRCEAAFTALKNALLIDPARGETYLNLATLLVDAGQFEDAIEALERAVRHEPRLPKARSRLAGQLSGRGKVKRAEALFRQSLGMDPDHLEGWMGLGRTLEDMGEADGARGAYLNVLRRRPDHAQALGGYLALLRDHDPASAASDEQASWLARAEEIVRDDKVKDEARALVGYGLAKYHDRDGNYGAAAQSGELANAARRRVSGPLDREAQTARVDGLIASYTSEFFNERRRFGVGSDQPVFIVGLPRSGTTLTEQILAAHPLLHGAGELTDLPRIAARCCADGEEPWRAALGIEKMQSRELAYEYLRALRDGAPRRRRRISDKSPLNFFQLAFAAVLFPNARVIHCRRDARDNALSIWMENFNPDQRYATDFDDLAFFTWEYRRLMAHWHDVLPLPILDVQYEDTVADLEGQARRIMQFLDVPWEPRCLDFHKSERAVQTPSRWQVRQPIYSRSVGRWRAYADCLPGLTTAFAGP